MIPNSVTATLGETVHRLRERNGLSLRMLGERTGFSASFLSQVENGQASPSIASLERIATALGVTLGEFFQVGGEGAPVVVRSGERANITSQWSNANLASLGRAGARLEPVLITIEPGGASANRAHPARQEEFAFVVEGEVVLTLGEDTHALQSGDAVTIAAGTPRAWSNKSALATQILLVSLSAGA